MFIFWHPLGLSFSGGGGGVEMTLEETETFAPAQCSDESRKALPMAWWLLEAVEGLG